MKSKDPSVHALVDLIKTILEDHKAQNTLELDVMGLSDIADVMIVTSGTSSRHVKSIADGLAEKVKQAGFKILGVEGSKEAEWILVDLADVIVHVMLPNTRNFYDLERLWSARPRDLHA